MFGINFLRKPAPQPLRAIVATKAENLLARRKAADVRMELAVIHARLSPEQRQAARNRGSARLDTDTILYDAVAAALQSDGAEQTERTET